MKAVVEKHRFRDGLVWTAGLTVEIKLPCHISLVSTEPQVTGFSIPVLNNIENIVVAFYICFRVLYFLLLRKTSCFTQVLKKRVPFLMNSIVDFKEHFPHGNNDRPVSEPFARSGHVVRNKLCWDANNAVGL